MIDLILHIVEWFLIVLIGFNVAYVSFFVVASNFYKRTKFEDLKADKLNKFLILIPAYKSDEVVLDTVNHALNQNYPKELFEIALIGDSLNDATNNELSILPITFFKVNFTNSSKAKSINYALNLLKGNYDYCLLLDVDNIIKEDFLSKINLRLQNNEIVVQAHRTAKNTDTSFAILDGISEEINNTIFRKGHIVIGLSASLIGSGKVINYQYFKNAMQNIYSSVEDKELEITLVKDKIFVHYEDDLFVYDEKVYSADVFSTQRKRWMSSQLFGAHSVIVQGIYHLFKNGNANYFDKAIQRVLLPRIVLFGLSFLAAISVFFSFFNYAFLFVVFLKVLILSYLIALPSYYFNKKTLLACLQIPKAFALIFIAFFKSKGASKTFTATPKVFKVK